MNSWYTILKKKTKQNTHTKNNDKGVCGWGGGSHVDYKKWLCLPVEFKKVPCRPVDFKKVPCRPVNFKKVPCRMSLGPKKVVKSISGVYTHINSIITFHRSQLYSSGTPFLDTVSATYQVWWILIPLELVTLLHFGSSRF